LQNAIAYHTIGWRCTCCITAAVVGLAPAFWEKSVIMLKTNATINFWHKNSNILKTKSL
jgi:hypothetical protein